MKKNTLFITFLSPAVFKIYYSNVLEERDWKRLTLKEGWKLKESTWSDYSGTQGMRNRTQQFIGEERRAGIRWDGSYGTMKIRGEGGGIWNSKHILVTTDLVWVRVILPNRDEPRNTFLRERKVLSRHTVHSRFL